MVDYWAGLARRLTATVFSRVIAHGRLKFTGQKTQVGVYTEKLFVRISHIHTDHKNGGGRLLGRIRYLRTCTSCFQVLTCVRHGHVNSSKLQVKLSSYNVLYSFVPALGERDCDISQNNNIP